MPHAFLVLTSSVSSEELTVFCRERLAKYKIPAAFFEVDELPRNASNKLMRHRLNELRKGELS
ncbi:2-succinylbenzoate--CoA ligase [Bacillus velezensis]